MDKLSIALSCRDVQGKKTRFLRRQGLIPCHIFGHNIASETVQGSNTELEALIGRAGTTRLVNLDIGEKVTRLVFVREIQRTAIGGKLVHVDFYQVKMNEKIRAQIPVRIRGESIALKSKGRILIHPVSHIEVESLPANLPPYLDVDISSLTEMDQSIHLRDIKLDADVTVLTEGEALLAKISEISVKVEEEVAAVGPAAAAAAVAAVPAEGAAPAAEGSAAPAKIEAAKPAKA